MSSHFIQPRPDQCVPLDRFTPDDLLLDRPGRRNRHNGRTTHPCSLKAADTLRSAPRGLTLLEVILALAIFAGSMAALSQLITTGLQAAVSARFQTQAILRCQSKMDEVVAGYQPMEPVADEPFEDDPNWTWSLENEIGPHDALLQLVVTVIHNDETGFASTSFRLSRYIRDPQIYLDAELEETIEGT